MPWWSWVWVAVMLVVTVGGARLDLRDREPVWYMALGVASGLACIVFVLNFFGSLRLGNLALPAVVTLVFLVYEAWRDVKSNQEHTAAEKALAFVTTLALFAPAAVLGLLGSEA